MQIILKITFLVHASCEKWQNLLLNVLMRTNDIFCKMPLILAKEKKKKFEIRSHNVTWLRSMRTHPPGPFIGCFGYLYLLNIYVKCYWFELSWGKFLNKTLTLQNMMQITSLLERNRILHIIGDFQSHVFALERLICVHLCQLISRQAHGQLRKSYISIFLWKECVSLL